MVEDEKMMRNFRGLTKRESQLFEEILSATNNPEPLVYCEYNFLVYRGAVLFLDTPMWGGSNYEDLNTHLVFEEIKKIGSIRTATYPCLYLHNHRGFMVPGYVLGWHDVHMKYGYANEEEHKMAEEAIAALSDAKKREQEERLQAASSAERECEDEKASILSTSPLLDESAATYVVVYLIHCPKSGVPGSPEYAISQTESDARIIYAEKLRQVIELASKEDDKSIYNEYDQEWYFYYYWCCLLRVPAKLQSSKEFYNFVKNYRDERDLSGEDADFESYNELFRSFVIDEAFSEDDPDMNCLDNYLLDIWY